MITLYHGSTETVEAPRVDAGRLGLDFGPGFYVTKILDQAEKWAQRTSRQRLEPPVVNIYEFDEVKASAYRRLKFDNYDSAWLEFVVACRTCIGRTVKAQSQPSDLFPECRYGQDLFNL